MSRKSRLSRVLSKISGINCILAGLVLLFVFTVFGASPVSAADESISVTISGNPSITVAPTSEGTFADSGDINISVTSTARLGYTLAIAGGGNTSLVGKTDSSKSIQSISSAMDRSTFDTAANNNKWGYKPSMHYDTTQGQRATNTNYLPSPDANGDIIDITDDDSDNNYTLSIGARVTNTLGFQSYENNTFVVTAIGAPDPCNNTKLCVEYNGNGLKFNEASMNAVNYDSISSPVPETKYSHTPNISDAGVQNGNYSNSYTMNDVITIEGAPTLHIKLTYGGESASWDWVSFWEGNHPDYYADSNYSSGIQNCGGGTVTDGRYGGTNGTTVECDVPGDTVTFAFKSDGSDVGNGYGYYAVITGFTPGNRTVSSGAYAIPTGTNAIFHGWSSTATTPGGGLPSEVEYTDEAAVMANIPGDNGETKTLYAVWQQGQSITFTYDSNVTSVNILDSDGNLAGTISSSGDSLVLVQGSTYTIVPFHTAYHGTNAITKVSGAGTLSGNQFTVGAGSTAINITSKEYCKDAKTMQEYNSSNLAALIPNVGNETTLCDIRDGKEYTVAHMADGNIWMNQNLDLELSDSTPLTSENTDLNESGSGAYSDGYTKDPTTNVITWTPASTATTANHVINSDNSVSNWSDSHVAPYSAEGGDVYVYTSGSSSNDTVYNSLADCIAASHAEAECKHYHRGNYYNWTAAIASNASSSIRSDGSTAANSVCPKGWRLPKGNENNNVYELGTVLLNAGVISSIPGVGETVDYANDGFNKIRTTPLYLVRSGDIWPSRLNDSASAGCYWSSTVVSISNANFLYFNSSRVRPRHSNNRTFGFSVRCLAPAS